MNYTNPWNYSLRWAQWTQRRYCVRGGQTIGTAQSPPQSTEAWGRVTSDIAAQHHRQRHLESHTLYLWQRFMQMLCRCVENSSSGYRFSLTLNNFHFQVYYLSLAWIPVRNWYIGPKNSPLKFECVSTITFGLSEKYLVKILHPCASDHHVSVLPVPVYNSTTFGFLAAICMCACTCQGLSRATSYSRGNLKDDVSSFS